MQRLQYQMEATQGGMSLYSPQGRGRQVSTQGRGDQANTQGRMDQDLGLCTFSGRLRTVQHWLQGPGLPASVMFRVYARWVD